ncbi:MAG: rhomboid family intramembrane serine protease [Rhodobacterales bacterium]|nr:rhomboid family intramembrane serine protease [Rhodobacterales bacterium]
MNSTSSTHRRLRSAPQPGAPAFLWWLVGIMALIELVLTLSSYGIFGTQDLRWPAFALGAFWQPLLWGAAQPIYPGQTVLMFLTYAFLHGGMLHLAMNSVVLLSLGKHVCSHFGARRTLLVLFLAAVGGAATFGLLAPSDAPMIGASGAVFGLIGLWQGTDYSARRRSGLSVQPIIVAVLGLVAANIGLMFILGGGLAWQAHLGGWLVGWLAAQGFVRRRETV